MKNLDFSLICYTFTILVSTFVFKFCNSYPLPNTVNEALQFPQNNSTHKIDPIKYLQSFGWLEIKEGRDEETTESEISEAFLNFQAFAGINETGISDPQTLRVMTLPRCGETDTDYDPDVEPIERTRKGKRSRRKRFVLQGTRWRTREIRYKISKYTSDLPASDVDSIIASAFNEWENVANISFFPVTEGKVHIDIRFENKYHGDEETFDGPGGTTAHAYFPVYGGAVHFDDDEDWTQDSDWGVNLFQVATHEIGHALGLEHSNVQESVMAPFYRTFRKDFKLMQDDMDAIQVLYGKRVLTICDDAKVDAATTMEDGSTYVFKGIYVYQLNKESHMVDGSATAISVAFPGLPSNLDAAITRSNGVSYFFKGTEFWRVTNMTVDPVAKKIQDFFPGIPTPIDAAMVFSDENIYFFKGGDYWKFDPLRDPPVNEGGYPKPIYSWPGLPERIDAGASLSDAYGNSFTLFFKGREYWKFNDKSFSVYIANPPYPRLVSRHLFGCRM